MLVLVKNTDPIHNHCIYREVSRQTATGKNILNFLFIWKILRILRAFLRKMLWGRFFLTCVVTGAAGIQISVRRKGGVVR